MPDERDAGSGRARGSGSCRCSAARDADRVARAPARGARAARARTRARSRSRPRSASARCGRRASARACRPSARCTQSQQKTWSPVTHELPLPKFGDDRAGRPAITAAAPRRARAGGRPRGSPSSPATSTRSVAGLRASARPRCGPSSRGHGRPSGVGPGGRRPGRARPRRRAAAPAAAARGPRRRTASTNSSAGCARIASGVSYCASTPPSRRIAMRSPIVIASSMSCVTKIDRLRRPRGAAAATRAGAARA